MPDQQPDTPAERIWLVRVEGLVADETQLALRLLGLYPAGVLWLMGDRYTDFNILAASIDDARTAATGVLERYGLVPLSVEAFDADSAADSGPR